MWARRSESFSLNRASLLSGTGRETFPEARLGTGPADSGPFWNPSASASRTLAPSANQRTGAGPSLHVLRFLPNYARPEPCANESSGAGPVQGQEMAATAEPVSRGRRRGLTVAPPSHAPLRL